MHFPHLARLQIFKKTKLKKLEGLFGGGGGDFVVVALWQVDVALMMDAVDVIVHGLRSLLIHKPEVFRKSFRRGQVFNNETRGIHCDRDPIVPWVHGRTILKHLLDVNFTGVTGPLTFDPVTGQRSQYRLDVMALRYDAELRKVITARLLYNYIRLYSPRK